MSAQETPASFDRILVTAALPYANGPVHLGHLAGAYLPADLYCRYQRMKGRDVVFVSGSDEMGVAIMVRAKKQGIEPQDIVDQFHPMIVEAFEGFGMSFDYYGRTTSERHRETSQDFFRRLAARGAFELKTNEQLYDPKAGLFLADRFVIGTCPVCGYEEAYGDQCEKCGTSLSPMELINPRSTLSDATPELRETTHWYLPLGTFQEDLEAWIATRTQWKPNVLGQVKSWFKDGLKARAITRDVPWGVPVPEDVAAAVGVDATGKVIYVWFDAPIGYISATREWAEAQGDPERWKTYWQDSGTKLVHFIGKDNIVFHCLMFPAMLQAHGDYVLPEDVPANEFLNIQGRKLSTSRGWAIWLHEFLQTFDPDYLRYALATTLPETKDADFSWNDFQARVNSELADILGNFVNRSLTFAHRFFDGKVPSFVDPTEEDQAVLDQLQTFPATVGESYEAYRNREAVFETMKLARLGNKYFNDTEPWKTRKTNPQACANTVHVSLQLCASLAVLLEPVLPHSAATLRAALNLTGVRSSTPSTTPVASLGAEIGWDEAGEPLLEAGASVEKPAILFEKIPDEVIQAQIDALLATDAAEDAAEEGPAYEALKDTIVFDDFTKLDVRVGVVTAAEKVRKSKELLALQVDLGFEQRQILSGVAQFLDPEELVGTNVAVVANLAPRKMMGMESQGMILFAEDRDGRLSPVVPHGEPGGVVR